MFILHSDVIGQGIGTGLSQTDIDGKGRLVASISCKLIPRELAYSAVENETIASQMGTCEAQGLPILGSQPPVQTDHELL